MSEQGPETTGEQKGKSNSCLDWLVDRAVNLTPERRREVIGEERRIRAGILIAAVAVVAVSIPLGIQSWTGIKTNRDTSVASDRVQAWLKDTGLQETGIEVDGERVMVDVVGPEKPPPPGPLAEDLAKELGSPVKVNVQWTKRLETSAGSRP